MIQDDERTLVDRLKKNDDAAWAEFQKRHIGWMWTVATEMLGNGEDANDAVNDSVARACANILRFRCESSLRTWVSRILIHVCIDMREKARRERSFTVPLEAADTSPARVVQNAPLKHVIAEDLRQMVNQSLAAIDPKYRQVLVMYHYDGFSYDEIALKLDAPLGTIKTWIDRARKRLRKEMLDQGFHVADDLPE